MVIQKVLVDLLGVFIFLFLLWKKLKDDYSSHQIFSLAFLSLFFSLGLILVSRYIYPEAWFWFAFLGMAAGFVFSVYRFKLMFYEVLEGLAVSLIPLLAFQYLFDSVANASFSSFFLLIFLVFLSGLYIFLDRHYMKFGWYKSGRIGFSGLVILALFFLLRIAVAVLSKGVISFIGNYDWLISGVLSFLFFLLLFNLSRTK